jgi:hypothetical protein
MAARTASPAFVAHNGQAIEAAEANKERHNITMLDFMMRFSNLFFMLISFPGFANKI